jgi:membrane dipeptidase
VHWFDGHLDLTYIADHGRDLTRDLATCGGRLQPASVTFPSLRAGGIFAVISTLFVCRRTGDPALGLEPDPGPWSYDTPDEAHAAAVRQVRMHEAWESAGLIEISKPNLQDSKLAPVVSRNSKLETRNSLCVVLAIEGAACLRTLDDFQFFYDAGVRMVSLGWAEGSPWSGGDRSGGDITPAGKQLIDLLDALGCIHDVSHLSDRAFWTLMDQAKGPKVASHSNARALLPGAKSPERHLSDDQIRALVASGGLIGINLFAPFLVPPAELKQKTRRATAADVVRHMDHMAQITGRRDFLALGSDMDGGFSANQLPTDLQSPHELTHLADALSRAGWSDPEIQDFAARWETLSPGQ